MRYTLAGAFQLIIVPVSGVRSQFVKRSFAARRGALAASTAFAALMSLSSESFAGPSGGSVVQGNANIATAGSVTNINQSSDKAIINWQSFSVGKGETVNFNQPSTTSVTLNRVTGNESSVIAGALNANGRVVLVNSNGILFSQGSQVNVGGLVASTLDISDANFMAGNYHFEGTSAASVVNQGHIRASGGGYVALLGKTVSNDGVISATLGTVAMASGNKITLNFDGNSLIDVTIDEGTLNAFVQNKGAIKADGGRVILTAKAADSILSAQVNNSGIIQARTMSALKGGGSNAVRIGTIKLTANGGSVSSSGKLIASAKKGGNGGTVSLAATGGSVTVAGEVDVSSVSGTGGTVTVTGQDVVLTSMASINADGATGGIILVGGDRHGGSDPTENLIAETLANATTTTVAAGATLSANGTNGNGGAIIVWSNDYTNYAGSISATGAGNGNGGFAEVSSEGVLGFTGTANLLSVNGITGTLLLDPYNVVISTLSDNAVTSSDGTISPTGTSNINIANLVTALATANVTITTGGSAGSDAGNITIQNPLSWTTPHTLTLLAANEIDINAAVSWGTGGGLIATATAGSIYVTQPITWTNGTLSLTAGQGIFINSTLTGVSTALTAGTDVNFNAAVSWGAGGGLTATAGGNVNVNANSSITWSAGTLSLNAGKNIYIGGSLVASHTGNFAATYGSGTNADGTANGLYMTMDTSGAYAGHINFDSTATGNVTLQGQPYTIINSAAALRNAEATPSSNYVLGSDITNLTIADLAAIGLSSASTFTGNFNGFGHQLVLQTQNGVTASSLSIPGTITNTNIVLNSSGDITLNSLSWASNIVTLVAANNISVSNLATSGQGVSNGLTLEAGQNATLSGTNIKINALNWYANALSLTASNNINIGNLYIIDASAANGLQLSAGNDINVSSAGSITINGSLSAKTLELTAAGEIDINAALSGASSNAVFALTAGTDININTAQNLTSASLIANATRNINLNTALNLGTGTIGLTAGTDINFNAAVNWGTGGGLIATASGGNVTVNAPITWSAGTLALNAGRNVYINNVLTATGSGSFAETSGTATGVNNGGQAYGFYLAIGATGYTGRIDISGTGSVTLNGTSYQVIDTAAQLATAESNLSSNYVLGANIANLSYADLAIFGFGSSSTFTGNVVGFGHSVSISPTVDLTIASAVLIPANITLTNFILTSTSDLNVNGAVSWSSNLLSLNAAYNVYVNAVMTMTNNASFAATYGTGTNTDGYTPYGLYTAQGTNDTFVGKVNISGYGSVWLQNQLYTVINTVSGLTNASGSSGNFVLGSDLTSAGSTHIGSAGSPFNGKFNGFGHTVSGLTATGLHSSSSGLFGAIGSSGVVSNVGVIGASIKLDPSTSVTNSGVLADVNAGSIINAFAQGSISPQFEINVGGLVGDNSGLIINSHADITYLQWAQTENQYFGGFVGVNESTGKIYDSYSTGTILAYTYSGGFAGLNAGLIDSSYSSGLIQVVDTGSSAKAGGFVGWNTGQIRNSYTTVSTTGSGADSVAATIAGFAYRNDGTISNSYSAGTLGSATASWSLAGFVYNNTGSISSVYSAETLLSSNIAAYVSAFSNTNSGTITNAYWDMSLAGGATESASNATGLDATRARSLASYAGFSTSYWASSADGHPILSTIPIYIVPTANSNLQYGSDGAAIASNLTVVGLQWGDTAADIFTSSAAGSLLSQSGFVNAGTYNYAQLVTGSVYSYISGAITISPKVLTLSADGIVNDKTYDTTLAATIDVTAANNGLVGLVGNETLGASYSNASFLDKNAGTDKTVSVNVVLSNGTNGGLSSNYTILVKTTTATITPATLTAISTAANKTYDGTTTATVTTTSLTGVLGSDQVSVSTTGQFANANAGTGKLVTTSLTGNDAGNYVISSASVTADILPRVLDLTGVKLADGTTTVAASQLQATNLVAGDSVTLSGSASLTSAASGLQSFASTAGLSQTNSNYTLAGATGSVAVLSSYLPVLSSIASGSVTTASTANSLTVNQSTQSAIINWTSFNIAPGYSVIFNQPSATSITLNRIIGNETSVIAGSLSANGRLIFVNSAGILFAAGSTVNVGGIIASTQDIADADFLAGRYNFGANAATGSIDVLGNITINQAGSYAAFIGNGVSTRGTIRAPGGTILLAGGDTISLTIGTGLSAFTVTNANKAVSAGGVIDVSSTTGNGGLIATQGSTVSTTESLLASATGASGFTNGYWLIRQNGDLTIGSGGTISGANLNYLLNQISVTTQASAAGNINVNDAISWSKNTLSLNAIANIYVNNVMTASGTANLSGTYGTGFNADGSTMGLFTKVGTSDVLNSTYAGKINFSSSGTVTLNGHLYTAINSLTQLAAISGTNGYYFLAQDLTDYVAYTTTVVATFRGTLDGFGHVINNLTINGSGSLIGTLGSSTVSTAVVRNLGLTNETISTTGSGAAGLLLTNYGTISNSFATGSLTGQSNIGGLVFSNNKTIENSFAVMTIVSGLPSTNGYASNGGRTGGLVVTTGTNSFILNSHAIGTITANSADDVGGLVAFNAGRIDNSWSNVNITANAAATGGFVGGLVAENAATGVIYNGSHALGDIVGDYTQAIGGLVASNLGSVVGTTDGVFHTDANYYTLHPEQIAWNYAMGNITITHASGNNYGGLVGGNSGTVEYGYATGNVTVYADPGVLVQNVGGIIGNSNGGIIGNLYYSGVVTSNAQNVGDTLGNATNTTTVGTVTKCSPGTNGCPIPLPINGGGGGGGGGSGPTDNSGGAGGGGGGSSNNGLTGNDTGTGSNSGNGTGTGTGTGTGSSTGAGTGTGIGTGTGTGSGGASLGGQAARAGGSAIAGTAGGGGSSSSSPDSNNPAGAQQQSASLNPNSLDDQISSQVPATTTPPPPAKPKEKKERKALNTPKQKPDAGYGAEIRSIVIDGQKYDLQDEGPKNGDTPKTDAPAGDAPNNAAPSAPAPAGDKPQ